MKLNINLGEDWKDRVWFTSDWHLGHKNIVGPDVSNWKSGYRDFKSLDQMNDTIINNINSLVMPDHILFNVGDICIRDNPRSWYDRINCNNNYICVGNHDRLSKLKQIPNAIVSDIFKVKFNNEDLRVFMSHYAHRVWDRSHHGAYHIYGHSHNSLADDWGLSLDVGIDSIYAKFGEYRPISYRELENYMKSREIKAVDHHRK